VSARIAAALVFALALLCGAVAPGAAAAGSGPATPAAADTRSGTGERDARRGVSEPGGTRRSRGVRRRPVRGTDRHYRMDAHRRHGDRDASEPDVRGDRRVLDGARTRANRHGPSGRTALRTAVVGRRRRPPGAERRGRNRRERALSDRSGVRDPRLRGRRVATGRSDRPRSDPDRRGRSDCVRASRLAGQDGRHAPEGRRSAPRRGLHVHLRTGHGRAGGCLRAGCYGSTSPRRCAGRRRQRTAGPTARPAGRRRYRGPTPRRTAHPVPTPSPEIRGRRRPGAGLDGELQAGRNRRHVEPRLGCRSRRSRRGRCL